MTNSIILLFTQGEYMGPVLEALTKLQSIENRLRAAKGKLTRCRRRVVIQENQVRNLQNALEAKKEELQLTRVQADKLQLELKSRDEKINKLRAALNNAKSNKEYSSILTQMNTTKADNSKLEEQTLELMKDIETDEAECNEIKQQIEEQKQKLEKIRAETNEQAEKFEKDVEEIQAQWDKQAKDIPPEPLELFKRLAETYDGEATAEIEEQEGRNTQYTCGGCFMTITNESVNQLMTKDDIIRCPNCTRILVLENQQQT
jgi:hypothetical protein